MAAANMLADGKWQPGETPERFAVRMSQYQQVIAACRQVLSIPREIIEEGKKREDKNGTR